MRAERCGRAAATDGRLRAARTLARTTTAAASALRGGARRSGRAAEPIRSADRRRRVTGSMPPRGATPAKGRSGRKEGARDGA